MATLQTAGRAAMKAGLSAGGGKRFSWTMVLTPIIIVSLTNVLFSERSRMPNIAKVLKDEMARIARREANTVVAPARKPAAGLKRTAADLKRKVATLEKEVRSLQRTVAVRLSPAAGLRAGAT